MDSAVPPVTRGEFVYRDVLLVDVGGDGKRHARAAESEIKSLLAGKTKDMVGHWWEAQLIHYGLTEQLPEAADTLRLFMCVDQDTGITWGSFELAMKSGVIKIDDIGVERKLSFGWRSRDSETTRLQFGKGCFGDIAFYGDEQVRGCFYNLFPSTNGGFALAEFEGMRRPGPAWCGRSAPSFRDEWEDFPKEAYGR